MTDYRNLDPRLNDPSPQDMDLASTPNPRLDETSSNAMWGWVLGAIVLAVVLAFIFTSGGDNRTAGTSPTGTPPATTGSAPMTPPAGAPRTTTGQGIPNAPSPAAPANQGQNR
jgi:hypothetical protein